MQANPHASSVSRSSGAPRAVTINVSLFRASRGDEPRGPGWWTFDFYSAGQCLERHWRYGGEYSNALVAVRAHAERIGAGGVELLP